MMILAFSHSVFWEKDFSILMRYPQSFLKYCTRAKTKLNIVFSTSDNDSPDSNHVYSNQVFNQCPVATSTDPHSFFSKRPLTILCRATLSLRERKFTPKQQFLHLLAFYGEKRQKVLNNLADPNYTANNKTSLQICLVRYYHNLALKLVKNGAQVNTNDNFQPLALACKINTERCGYGFLVNIELRFSH